MQKKKWLLYFLILIVLPLAQSTYYDYKDVVLVCNANSLESQEICEYFLQERATKGFSENNIINLTNTPTDETINATQYLAILSKINSSLKEIENSGTTINYIITTVGIPLRTGLGYSCDTIVNNMIPSECKSVDSRLMKDLGANNSYHSREYNYVKTKFNHTRYGGYLITRLDGPSIGSIKQLIDSSTNAQENGLSGSILLNCYTNNPSLSPYNSNCLAAKETIESKDIQVTLNNTTFVINSQNLGGYVSWGSNAENTLIAKNSSSWNLSFNPGAIGETYVSTSARTLHQYPYNGTGPFNAQSLISDLIVYNITGIKGYVYEPFTSALANVNTLWERYLSGYNLADSYYMASSARNWTDIIIGDPKTTVIPQSVNNPTILNNLLNGERIPNGTIINFTINSNDFWEIDTIWYSTNNGETNHSFEQEFLFHASEFGEYGEHNLTIFLNDSNGNSNSKTFNFIFNTTIGKTPTYSKFKGNSTTNIKILENKEQVENLTLEIEGIGKIVFFETINLSGLDLNSNIDLENNFVYLDSKNLPQLNVSANITLYNVPEIVNPIIYKDNRQCSDCFNFTPLNSEIVTFNVSSFSKYTIQELGETELNSCINITQSGRYILTQNVSSNATCFNITANNVYLDGNQYEISYGLANNVNPNYGIYSSGNYTTIRNISITNKNNTKASKYGLQFYNNQRNKIEYINTTENYYGINLVNSDNNEMLHLIANKNFYGIMLNNANYNTLTNLTIEENNYAGLYLLSNSRETFVTKFFAQKNYYGLYLQNSANNIIYSSLINNNTNTGILIQESNNIILNNVSATNNTNQDFLTSGYSYRLNFVDCILANYKMSSTARATLTIQNSTAGKIEFLESIHTSNNKRNFMQDFTLRNNYSFVNSTANIYLGVPANIELYNLNILENPKIYKENTLCINCYNYTPLNQENISFYVPSASYYNIQNQPNIDYLAIAIASPTTFNYTNISQELLINYESSKEIDKIWYNWNNTNITYTGQINIAFREGENTIHAWINTTDGNQTYTNITFFIDSIPPNISFISPLNNFIYNTSEIIININSSEDAVQTWFKNNSAEINYTGLITINFSKGNHTLTAYAIDLFGNLIQQEINFSVVLPVQEETTEKNNYLNSGGGSGGGGGGASSNTSKENINQTKLKEILKEEIDTTKTESTNKKETESEEIRTKQLILICISIIFSIISVLSIFYLFKKVSRY